MSWRRHTTELGRLLSVFVASATLAGAQPTRIDTTASARRVAALVRVEHPGPTVLALAPGERITTLFRIVNESDAALTLQPRVRHPATWRLITPEPPFVVSARAAELRLISVVVPRDAAPERHWLVYEASGPTGEVSRDSVRIAVNAQLRVSVATTDMPTIAATHRSYNATFVARNTGNVRVALRSRAVGPLARSARVDTTAWLLEPGASRSIVLEVQARDVAKLRGAYYVGVQVRSVDDSTISGNAGSVVEFLTRGDAQSAPGHELPATLALRYAPNARESERIAVDFVAQGPIVRDSTTSVHLVARSAGPQSSPLFEQDEYRVTLRTPRWTLRAGDQWFEQSPLTEAGRLTFGFGTTLATRRLSASVFDLSSRWQYNDGRSRGGSIAIRLADSASVRLNALSHSGGDDAGRVVSLGASAAPAAGAHFGLEIGRGWPDSLASVGGIAWRAQITRPSWHAAWTGHTTEDRYPARNGYGDHQDASASAALTPSLRLRVNATTREFERRVRGVHHSLHTDLRSLGIQLGALGSVEWREQDLSSRLDSASVDESERGARLLLHRTLHSVQISSVLESGTVDVHPQALRRRFDRASLRTGVGNSTASLSLFGDYTSRGATAGAAAERWLSTGIVSTASLGRTQFALMALNARDGTFARVRFSMLDARVARAVGRVSRLSLRWRSLTFGPYTTGRESHVAIEYATGFGIPLGRDRSHGRLLATIVDRESGRGVPNAIVALASERFLTDDEGRLVLDRVMPGTYPLSITTAATSSQPVGTVAVNGPSSVTIRPAATERVDVGFARGARLTGRLSFAPPGDTLRTTPTTDTTAVGVPNVLVTAAGERDTLRQVTDADGAFTFAGLAPGRWTLSVSQNDAPANHRFHPSSLLLTLDPGQRARVTLGVVPVPRGIRWREGGELIERGRAPLPKTR